MVRFRLLGCLAATSALALGLAFGCGSERPFAETPDSGGDADANAEDVMLPPSGVRDQSCDAGRRGAAFGCGAADASCCIASSMPAGEYGFFVASDEYSLGTYKTVLSAFELDTHEVTVGRFRTFVDALDGWRPRAGDGALATVPRSGWREGWPLTTGMQLRSELTSCAGSWTVAPGTQEALPMACITWFEAFAFCIWDGGRLPTIAERVYTAMGGVEQRKYPWSPAGDLDAAVEDARAASSPEGGIARTGPADVGSYPLGVGRWGPLDLSGNVAEWVLDRSPPDPFPASALGGCRDCAVLAEGNDEKRLHAGGAYASTDSQILSWSVGDALPTARLPTVGVRCVK